MVFKFGFIDGNSSLCLCSFWFQESNVNLFGNSWKLDEKCLDESEEIYDPCGEADEAVAEQAKKLCSMLDRGNGDSMYNKLLYFHFIFVAVEIS